MTKVIRTTDQIISRVRRILQAASVHSKAGLNWVENDLQWNSVGYVEPGYDSAGLPVLVANWNNPDRYDATTKTRIDTDDTPERVGKLIERLGIDLEWRDEWACCESCGGLLRTEPDGHGWKPSWGIINGEHWCAGCIKADPAEYLESLEGTTKAMTLDIDLAQHGYQLRQDSLESGLHSGMTDSPKAIAKSLKAEGITRFIFKLDESSQFYITFSVWVPVPPVDDTHDVEPSLDEFIEGYIECMLWSSTDDDDRQLSDNYIEDDFAPGVVSSIVDDCGLFFAANLNDIKTGCNARNLDSSDSARAGHDFWLTRNGHGAGFWDGDWAEPMAARLTAAAKAFGECSVLVTDDGNLELYPR